MLSLTVFDIDSFVPHRNQRYGGLLLQPTSGACSLEATAAMMTRATG